jgi:hypothetical protein
MKEFEISGPQCPTHDSPAENGDVLDIVVHQNIRLSGVIISDILNSDHLLTILYILDHVKTEDLSEPVKNSQTGNGFKALSLI